MKPGVIIWMGPVSTSNLSGVVLPPNWQIVTISQEVVAPTQTGGVALTPTMFRTYAATLGQDPLGTLMKRATNSPELAVLASFSAGAGLLESILGVNTGDARIRAVLSADSYYGLAVKPGYLAQAKASIASGVPFWLTTSNVGSSLSSGLHSGSESVVPFADALGLGVTPAFPTGMPKPVVTRDDSGVQWLDYQGLYSHVQHATILAPAALNIWFNVLAGVRTLPYQGMQSTPPPTPNMPSEPPGPDTELSTGSKIALWVGSGLVGFFGMRWIRNQQRG